MAEANQFTVKLVDLLTLLVKNAGVHEGHWSLLVGWQLGSGNYGPTPDQTFPGVAVTLVNVGIQRVSGPIPEGPGIIMADAAEINPAPTAAGRSKAKARSG
jgi:hypothetical protein